MASLVAHSFAIPPRAQRRMAVVESAPRCPRIRTWTWYFLLSGAALLLGSTAAQAQVVLHGGAGVGMGQTPNPYNTSSPLAVHASGGIGAFIGPFVTVRSYLEYTRLQPDAGAVIEQVYPDGDPAAVALSGGAATATAMMLDLKFNTPLFRSLSPYALMGVGALRFTEADASLRLSDEESIEVEGETVFGPVLGVGGGINIVLSDRVALFVEGRYHMGFGSADAVAYAPVRMGFAFR